MCVWVGGVSKRHTRAKTEKKEYPSGYTTASTYIKIRHTGTKFIRSLLWHPMDIPYTNGDVSSVITTSFHTMGTDTVTWDVHNNMEETHGVEQ